MLFFTNEPILEGEKIDVSRYNDTNYKKYSFWAKNKTNPFLITVANTNYGKTVKKKI